jgi:regulator of sigma E protease
MTILVKILQFLLSLSIIVLIHEFGHFVFAKLYKARVEKFYLFFDPWFSLFKRKIGETEYGIGWVPLGGYTKISGMIDESMDREQMKQPPQPYEFRSKPSGQRLMIMIGGVLFNFISALLIYTCVLYVWGETYLPTANVKYGIVTDSVGYSIGLRNGDKILSVDNQKIEDFGQVTSDIVLNGRKSIQVDRDGEILNITIPVEYVARMLKGSGKIEARTPFSPYIVAGFGKKSPGKIAGILAGDELTSLDGNKFRWFDEFQRYISENRTRSIEVNILRNGTQIDIPVVPTPDGFLGIASSRTYDQIFELKTIKYGFLASVPAGISKGFRTIRDYLKQFKVIFSRHSKAYESLGGFITIGSIFPGVWEWQAFWNLTALLSIILAVMNILPIPALDGGHVMFVLYEVVTGKKPSDKFLEYAQMTGMIILLALLIFANGNDILRLIRK